MTDQPKTDGLLRPYALITERICAMLGQGVIPWRKPWNAETAEPVSLASGKRYCGVNVFMLEASAAVAGYRSRYWVTFRQALERGGNVRKGEQATPVVFWKILDKAGDRKGSDEDDDAEPAGRKVPILKHYHLFNVEQCEGIEYPAPTPTAARPFDPIAACEQIVHAMPRPPTIQHHGNRACYSPSRDEVTMPPRDQFIGADEYYSTLFHELVHATGHESRLNRAEIAKPSGFGSDPYAREELVAEMGATFLCGRAGIEQATLANSAAYIQNWIGRLRSDPKLVVLAAASAQKAADFILAETREAPAQEESHGDGERSSLAGEIAERLRKRAR